MGRSLLVWWDAPLPPLAGGGVQRPLRNSAPAGFLSRPAFPHPRDDAFKTDPAPARTGRISGISKALIEGIKGINKINERRGYSRYTLRHFCEDPISGDHTTRRTGPGPRHKHGQHAPAARRAVFEALTWGSISCQKGAKTAPGAKGGRSPSPAAATCSRRSGRSTRRSRRRRPP